MSARTPRFAPEILRRRLDPDLPGLEARLTAYRRQAFSRHIHDAWCVGLVLSGATRARLGAATYRIAAGEAALIGPGEPHACNPEPDGRLCSLVLSLDAAAIRLAVGGAGEPAFRAPLVRDSLLARRCAGLYRTLGTPCERLRKESLVCLALAPLFLRRAGRVPLREPGAAARVREYLRAHYRQNVPLAALAALAGRSPTHLLRLFKREYGLPPHAYQNHLRVERAKALLATDLPAAQVALAAGSADQSHPTRALTPPAGAPPPQYRRSLQS